jgi:hypothetical protein
MRLNAFLVRAGVNCESKKRPTKRSQKPPTFRGDKDPIRADQSSENSGPMCKKKQKIPLPIQGKAGVLSMRTPFSIPDPGAYAGTS